MSDKLQLALREVDVHLARVRLFEKRIEAGLYKNRVKHHGGFNGPRFTEQELLEDEVKTMERHVVNAQLSLDYALSLQEKGT